MPSNSEYVVLSGLEWDTEYDISVVAENQKGKSQPATMSFRTTTQPDAILGTLSQVTHAKLELNGQKNLEAKLKAQNQNI